MIWGVYRAYHCRIIHLTEQSLCFSINKWAPVWFEVVIVVTVKIIVILDMVLCSLVDRYQCFRGILLLCRWGQQVLQTLVHVVSIMEEVINWPFSKAALVVLQIHSFINSFSLWSVLWQVHSLFQSDSSLNFQYFQFSGRSSISCLCLTLHLSLTSVLSSTFPAITRFRRWYLCKVRPVQLAFIFTVCRIFLSSLTLCNTTSVLNDNSKWSSPPFSSTTLQNFPDISDLLSEVDDPLNCWNVLYKFLYHKVIFGLYTNWIIFKKKVSNKW